MTLGIGPEAQVTQVQAGSVDYKAIVKQIEQLMTDDVPSMIPAFNDNVCFIGKNVQGITPNPDGTTVWPRVRLTF